MTEGIGNIGDSGRVEQGLPLEKEVSNLLGNLKMQREIIKKSSEAGKSALLKEVEEQIVLLEKDLKVLKMPQSTTEQKVKHIGARIQALSSRFEVASEGGKPNKDAIVDHAARSRLWILDQALKDEGVKRAFSQIKGKEVSADFIMKVRALAPAIPKNIVKDLCDRQLQKTVVQRSKSAKMKKVQLTEMQRKEFEEMKAAFEEMVTNEKTHIASAQKYAVVMESVAKDVGLSKQDLATVSEFNAEVKARLALAEQLVKSLEAWQTYLFEENGFSEEKLSEFLTCMTDKGDKQIPSDRRQVGKLLSLYLKHMETVGVDQKKIQKILIDPKAPQIISQKKGDIEQAIIIWVQRAPRWPMTFAEFAKHGSRVLETQKSPMDDIVKVLQDSAGKVNARTALDEASQRNIDPRVLNLIFDACIKEKKDTAKKLVTKMVKKLVKEQKKELAAALSDVNQALKDMAKEKGLKQIDLPYLTVIKESDGKLKWIDASVPTKL